MTDEQSGSITHETEWDQTGQDDEPTGEKVPDPKGPIPEYLEEKEKRDADDEPDPDHETSAEVGAEDEPTEPA
jgi:hypothetical protein